MAGLIPGFAQCVTDLALLWLWCKPAPAALIRPPSLGTSTCCGCGPKKTKKTKKKFNSASVNTTSGVCGPHREAAWTTRETEEPSPRSQFSVWTLSSQKALGSSSTVLKEKPDLSAPGGHPASLTEAAGPGRSLVLQTRAHSGTQHEELHRPPAIRSCRFCLHIYIILSLLK